jgi:hypothetical protein
MPKRIGRLTRDTRWASLKFVLLACALGIVAAIGPNPSAAAEPNTSVRTWAETVLLSMEYDAKVATCRRWTTSPKLAVIEGSATDRKLIGEIVGHLNETLAHTPIKKIELVKVGDPRTNLRVYCVAKEKFATLSKTHGIKSGSEKDNGWFWIIWNGRHEVENGFVFLATDLLRGRELRHTALEEITQSLGLCNDSPAFRDSIFYESGRDYGSTQSLAARDKQLIVFFYNHVAPGADRSQLRVAFERHWSK